MSAEAFEGSLFPPSGPSMGILLTLTLLVFENLCEGQTAAFLYYENGAKF